MNAHSLPPPRNAPAPAAAARPAVSPVRGSTSGGCHGGADAELDEAPWLDVAPEPPPGLLGAWQAALLARASAALPAAAGAVAAAEHSPTQQALALAGATGQHLLQPGAVATLAAQAEAAPLRIEAEFKAGPGPAWQLGLQRGPDAAAWSLNLATSALPGAWAATQLPRLERRLRLQGHEVDTRWGGAADRPPTPAREDVDEP